MMFLGSPVTRIERLFYGSVVAIFSIVFNVAAIALMLNNMKPENFHAPQLFLMGLFLCLGIGLGGIAWRLIKGRGVKQGGGVLTPFTYKIIGCVFLLAAGLAFIALLSVQDVFSKHSLVSILIVLGMLFMATLCFIAARHRGAMKQLPEWENTND